MSIVTKEPTSKALDFAFSGPKDIGKGHRPEVIKIYQLRCRRDEMPIGTPLPDVTLKLSHEKTYLARELQHRFSFSIGKMGSTLSSMILLVDAPVYPAMHTEGRESYICPVKVSFASSSAHPVQYFDTELRIVPNPHSDREHFDMHYGRFLLLSLGGGEEQVHFRSEF